MPSPEEPAPLRAHRDLLTALDATGPDVVDHLDPLRLVPLLRVHLDEVERRLIEDARDRGASWARVAAALGLATRQAAEQRWLRLCASPEDDAGGRGPGAGGPGAGGPGAGGPGAGGPGAGGPGAGGAARDPGAARVARRRHQSVDAQFGPDIRELRASVRAVVRRLDGDPDWDGRHRRAALLRTTLGAAADAPPGGMFALAKEAIGDLDGVSRDRLGSPALRAALDRLRRAVDAATPSGRRDPDRP
nr:hypothetical protein [Micromonospora sp. DSM 115978]